MSKTVAVIAAVTYRRKPANTQSAIRADPPVAAVVLCVVQLAIKHSVQAAGSGRLHRQRPAMHVTRQ